MQEPGRAGTPRLGVSLRTEDERLLLRLRAALEAETGKRHSFAKVIRVALANLAKDKGIEA